MNYKIKGDEIIFDKTDEFDARSILQCGQMFRFFEVDGGYEVITGHSIAKICEQNGKVRIKTKNPEVFVNFFDLDEDYLSIRQKLGQYPILKSAGEYGKGIRIAKGEAEENIFFFIISQNNNIKRIQKIIEKMCEIGDDIDGKHKAFPSAKVLVRQPEEYFSSLGAGYRDKYLFEAAKTLANTNLEEIKKLDDHELYKWLLSFKGIGDKVACCIMLFGFHRTSSFPVDTWIEKVYKKYFFNGEKTRAQISDYFQKMFGPLSGIAQQYLFFYQRELDK